jgi:PHD/YefM family antitoxin component YafN of YafNO toxin-antitoxin module
MTRHVAVDDFYKNPAKYVDEVGDDPLYIGGSVVMVSREEFEGQVETAHLLSTPENSRRLPSAIKAAEELHKQGLPAAK